ncbi:MAG: hypothetical protein HS115_14470 [Spirochaetales bacterium]|nr:hypothetical protein [Spirochaetales bacterium]
MNIVRFLPVFFMLSCASGSYVFATAPGTGRGNCIPLKEAGEEHSPQNLKTRLEKQGLSCLVRDQVGAGSLLVCNRRKEDGSILFQAQASGRSEEECRRAVQRLQHLQKAIHGKTE